MARFFIPNQAGFALVGDADGGNIGGRDAGFAHGSFDNLLGTLPDFERVVLNPTWFGVDLLVLQLVKRDRRSGVVKEHAAGAGCALVYSCDIFSHLRLLSGLEQIIVD
jgi:hypothetical protein